MAAGDVDLQQILRSPGRLCANPTDLSLPWPHGGTGLGAVGRCFLSPNASFARIPDEAKKTATEVMFLGFDPVFRATLKQPYDQSVVARFWPNSTAGSVSGQRVISWPHTSLPAGTRMSTLAFKLLFTPYDFSHYGVYLPKAAPTIARECVLEFSVEEELRLLVEAIPLDDSQSPARNVLWGPLVDLTL